MRRLFVAIDVPAQVKERLEQLSRRLQSLQLDGRAVAVEGIHLTLKFLGQVAEDRLEPIVAALEEIADQSRALEVAVTGTGVFPGPGNPRVLWAGVQVSSELRELQRRIEGGLEELGFPPEGRPFKPHLTLMRLKSKKNLKELIAFLQSQEGRQPLGQIRADAFHLFQSHLSPRGARYTKLATLALSEGAPPI